LLRLSGFTNLNTTRTCSDRGVLEKLSEKLRTIFDMSFGPTTTHSLLRCGDLATDSHARNYPLLPPIPSRFAITLKLLARLGGLHKLVYDPLRPCSQTPRTPLKSVTTSKTFQPLLRLSGRRQLPWKPPICDIFSTPPSLYEVSDSNFTPLSLQVVSSFGSLPLPSFIARHLGKIVLPSK
jgi:hypothetical protein